MQGGEPLPAELPTVSMQCTRNPGPLGRARLRVLLGEDDISFILLPSDSRGRFHGKAEQRL